MDAAKRSHIISPATGGLICGGWPVATGESYYPLAKAYVTAFLGHYHLICEDCLTEAAKILEGFREPGL